MLKKYEMIKEDNLYRIVALKDFSNVQKGDKGGLIEKESNLSQKGDCWIYDYAKVYDDAEVYDNAKVLDGVTIKDSVKIHGHVVICGNIELSLSIKIHGKVVIIGNAEIEGGDF